jgi:hypothetical protein
VTSVAMNYSSTSSIMKNNTSISSTFTTTKTTTTTTTTSRYDERRRFRCSRRNSNTSNNSIISTNNNRIIRRRRNRNMNALKKENDIITNEEEEEEEEEGIPPMFPFESQRREEKIINTIDSVDMFIFKDMSKEELLKELEASIKIRKAMDVKLELIEDQLRSTVSEVCKILALKRELEFEHKRVKEELSELNRVRAK